MLTTNLFSELNIFEKRPNPVDVELIIYEFMEGRDHLIEAPSFWSPSNNGIRVRELQVGSPHILLKTAKESNSMLCCDRRQILAKIQRLGLQKWEVIILGICISLISKSRRFCFTLLASLLSKNLIFSSFLVSLIWTTKVVRLPDYSVEGQRILYAIGLKSSFT